MAIGKNVRRKGKYTCLDFPKLGVSLVSNNVTKKYGIYSHKKKPQDTTQKHKPSTGIKSIQIILACILGVTLISHLIMVLLKFV